MASSDDTCTELVHEYVSYYVLVESDQDQSQVSV